eukprot:g1255.t1
MLGLDFSGLGADRGEQSESNSDEDAGSGGTGSMPSDSAHFSSASLDPRLTETQARERGKALFQQREAAMQLKRHDPSMIPKVDALLAGHRFVDIVASLKKKYGTVPEGWDEVGAHESWAGWAPVVATDPESVQPWANAKSVIRFAVYAHYRTQDPALIGEAFLPLRVLVTDEAGGGPQRECKGWYALQPGVGGSAIADSPGARLGSVLVRAQLDLQRADVCSSMTAEQLEDELERRSALSIIKQGAADESATSALPSLAALTQARETGKLVHNYFGHALDRIEMTKNALNWTHPHKSQYIFNALAVVTVASAVVATRYIVLVIGVMEFSFHFWPDWYKEERTPLVDRIANMFASVPSDRVLRDVYAPANELFLDKERKSARYARTLRIRRRAQLQAIWTGQVAMKSASLGEWRNVFLVLRCGKALWWRSSQQALAGLSAEDEILLKHPHAGIGGLSPMLARELGDKAQLAASVFGLDYEGKPMKRDFVMKSPREKQSLERAVSSTLKQD